MGGRDCAPRHKRGGATDRKQAHHGGSTTRRTSSTSRGNERTASGVKGGESSVVGRARSLLVRQSSREFTDVLAMLSDAESRLPPPDALPAPTDAVSSVWNQMARGGLSSLVDQLRPKLMRKLTDLPEELLLAIVEQGFLHSIRSAQPVDRFAALGHTCRALRFVNSEQAAEVLARALYPPVMCNPTATADRYASWRERLHSDNSAAGVWCVEVEGAYCRVEGADGSYCEARLQSVALDLHDSLPEIIVLVDAAGDASALSHLMLHEHTRLRATDGKCLRGGLWSSPVYRLLGPGRQICEISFPADVLLDAPQKAATAGLSAMAAADAANDGTWAFSLWKLKFRTLRMGSQLARTTGELARLFRREGTFRPLPLPYDAEARGPISWRDRKSVV